MKQPFPSCVIIWCSNEGNDVVLGQFIDTG